MDDPIDDLTLERLEDNGAIARDELGLAVARDDHALAYVRDGYDGDDEAELAGAGALDVGIELRLEVLLHARSEVGRVQHDRMRELFLQRENWNAWLMGCERAREKKRRVTIKNIALWCSSWVRRRCVVTVVVGFLTVSRDSRRSPRLAEVTRHHSFDLSLIQYSTVVPPLYLYCRLCFRALRQEHVTASIEYTPGPLMVSAAQHD